jgi:hypothetical protein
MARSFALGRSLLAAIAASTLIGLFPATADATLVGYSVSFSEGGSGSLTYDDVNLDLPSIGFDFGSFGSLSTSFGATLTAQVFGAPPSTPFILQDNTFFGLSGGTASSLRLSSNGDYCLRADIGLCGTGDLVSGSYSINLVQEPSAAIPEPSAAILFSLGLGLVGFTTARRRS